MGTLMMSPLLSPEDLWYPRLEMGSSKHPIDYQPARMEVEVAVSTHDKVKQFFKPPEPLGLAEGLQKTVSWYRSKGKFFQPVEFASVEVLAHMPPSWVRDDLKETAICEGSRVRTEAIEADMVGENVCTAESGNCP